MISLQEKKWAKFSLSELGYEIINSKAYHKENLDYSRAELPYITRTHKNNGLTDLVVRDNQIINPKNTISFGAENADFFYQPFEYITGNKMYYIKAPLNKYQLLFIQRSLSKAISEQFSFGYGMIPSRVINKGFMLPVNDNQMPDYEFMEQYMREMENESLNKIRDKITKELSKLGSKKNIVPLNQKKHLPFKLGKIGSISSGRDIYQDERIDGEIPYITSGTSNNGIGYFVSNMNNTYGKNYISINRNGAVGESFYHSYYSLLGNDCRKFILNDESKRNKYVYLFLSTVITKQKSCFSYSRKLGTERAKNLDIMLPIKEDNNPDYEYMEQYIKNIMIEKYNRILEFINKA